MNRGSTQREGERERESCKVREKSAEMLGNRNLSNFAYCLNSNGSRYKLNPKVSKGTTSERQRQREGVSEQYGR